MVLKPQNFHTTTSDFYRHLPAIHSFEEATRSALHKDLPQDWWIVIADVIGSTKAIEAGAYKKVNTVGVACIAAVVNVDLNIDIPFLFGGDGATFAVPGCILNDVEIALRGAQKLSRESFSLSLRVGMVKVSDLSDDGFLVSLGKLQLSAHITQPVFSGSGWDEAEHRVKAIETVGVRRVNEQDGLAEASFDGFECRWQGVPSFNDHKLALLVCATGKYTDNNLLTYQRVFDKIQAIYGDVMHYHPLQAKALQLTVNPKLLAHEWRVRSSQFALIKRISYLVKMLFQNTAGKILFARNIDTEATQWSKYRDEFVDNSDFRKFDGMLRIVMDGTELQASQLQ